MRRKDKAVKVKFFVGIRLAAGGAFRAGLCEDSYRAGLLGLAFLRPKKQIWPFLKWLTSKFF